MKRRAFLGRSCACLGGLAVLDADFLRGQTPAGGSMAGWTAKHLAEGYWSADSIFLSALKYGGQPEDLVRVATPFGGGMGRKDLCGFLTGGLMAIGLFAGAKTGSDKAARQKCNRLSKEYQDWWAKSYPLHCAEINKSEAQPCDYMAMGAKVSEFLQTLFERETKKV